MISPSQEIVLVRAIRNKLKGNAHRSILGQVFEEVESRAIDMERELKTINAIRQVVLGERASDNKRSSAPLRRVNAESISCQYCHKNGHTADRCRLIANRQNQSNYNNTQVPLLPPPPRENHSNNLSTNSNNFNNNRSKTCRYFKKPRTSTR
ncbi:hypothetical protein X777_03877 [Ooceraea biroi]|uniref:CCHC-type domain-containing protein n=1 Tax=Ooceraea biroi TaxID=2015173 RepID=A0A026WJ31_OOCBI|nr:hypothetical protein X777_03877 [Ooceraea biroi]